MKKQKRSFADFALQKNNKIIIEEKKYAPDEEEKTIGKARPGKASLPTITFRVTQEQWERLKMLAIQDRTTIQSIAEQAFLTEFKRRGLPW